MKYENERNLSNHLSGKSLLDTFFSKQNERRKELKKLKKIKEKWKKIKENRKFVHFTGLTKQKK